MTYRRDDDDPAYWLYIISTPDGHVVKTTRFRLGEVFESTSVAGRPITVTIVQLRCFIRVHNTRERLQLIKLYSPKALVAKIYFFKHLEAPGDRKNFYPTKAADPAKLLHSALSCSCQNSVSTFLIRISNKIEWFVACDLRMSAKIAEQTSHYTLVFVCRYGLRFCFIFT